MGAHGLRSLSSWIRNYRDRMGAQRLQKMEMYHFAEAVILLALPLPYILRTGLCHPVAAPYLATGWLQAHLMKPKEMDFQAYSQLPYIEQMGLACS